MIRLLRVLLPRKEQDAVGKVLYWTVGVPLLAAALVGVFIIGSSGGGPLDGILALAKVSLVLWFLLIALMGVGQVFLSIGTRLEPRVGESAASVVALLVVGGGIAAVVAVAMNVLG